MAKVLDNFKPGDVIYGLRENRKPFAQEAFAKAFNSLPEDKLPWVVIDDYNNNTFIAGGDFNAALKNLEEVHRRKAISTTQKNMGAQYMQNLASSSYTPYEDFSAMPKDKLQRLHIKESSGKDMHTLQILRAIRRSCKYGLLNLSQALGQSVTIHFILDGYDKHGWETVIGKDMVKSKDMMRGSGMAVPVTTSEIRALYRNWHKIKQQVIFYEKDAEVAPPWEQDTRWMQYGLARYEKHKKELSGQVTQDSDFKLLDSYLQNAEQLCKSGYPNQATDALKIAPVYLKALKTPLPPVLEDDEL